MKKTEKKLWAKVSHGGSALILAVVLTSLLAIVGVLFVMASSVDNIATSAVSETKELEFAVDTVITEISRQLVLDVPGVAGQEYYDYPDANDAWLAALEPYALGGDYYWRQISNLYNNSFDPNVQAVPVIDYQDPGVIVEGAAADAEGDGVTDSRWAIVPNISSTKGKPIFAAVRIIDHGAMLNANTAFKFDPGDPNATLPALGGFSQLHIDLMGLAGAPGQPASASDETDLLYIRANSGVGVDPLDLRDYEQNVIWRYDDPNGPYTPFDISDELELRYRFLLNHSDIDTRLEQWGRFRGNTLSTPVSTGGKELDAWFQRAGDTSGLDPNYAYRHITTTYNMDRIINPAEQTLNDGKMINVNTADENLLYEAIQEGLGDIDPNVADANQLAAQLAVNLVDLRDRDTDVTVMSMGPATYYGLEVQPFISEIGFRISEADPNRPTNNDFAVELYNPFNIDIPLSNFRLELRRQTGDVAAVVNLAGYAIARRGRFVITNGSTASSTFGVSSLMSMGLGKEDPALVLALYDSVPGSDPPSYVLKERYDLWMLRQTTASEIFLDSQQTQDSWFTWDTAKNITQSFARADGNWNIVYQDLAAASNTLGNANGLESSRKNYNFYESSNATGFFTSVGEITRAMMIAPSPDPCDMIGVRLASEPLEEMVRLDLRNPIFAKIFQYLTVIDPANHGHSQYETRIKGRININTAPSFVMERLPWMEPDIARAIVTYRDTVAGAFESTGALCQVPEMGYYAYDPAYATVDLDRLPDLTPSDGAVSDFEERDIIFSRISDITTVRSDVFSAYILVRIGTDGPQKRVLAILDRSQVTSSADKVKIVALQTVPDPR